MDRNALDGEASGAALRQLLRGAPQLTHLSLAHCNLGPAAAAGLFEGMAAAKGLETLNLSHCQLDAASVEGLASAIGCCPAMQSLNVSGNPGLGDAAVAALSDAVAQASGTLGHLDLSSTSIGPGSIQHLGRMPSLARLDIFNTRLGDEGALALSDCFGKSQFAKLSDLNIAGCDVAMAGIKALCEALCSADHCLTTLEMGANPCTQTDELEALLESLREQRPGIDVHWRVGDSGADGGDSGT